MGYLDMALNAAQAGKKIQDREPPLSPKSVCEKSEESEIWGPLKRSKGLKEVYRDIFEQALSYISVQYLPGTLEMIREDFPNLAREIQEVEDRINSLWLSAEGWAGDPASFRDTVDKWKGLHLITIKIFRFLENNN